MKIKYYGTAAAEGFPGMFCSCPTCEKARKAGGKNIRTRSGTVIDDELMIDFSADTYLHVLNYGLDLRKIKACLVTHGHDDHLYPYDFHYRGYGYAYFPDEEAKKPLQIYSTEESSSELLPIVNQIRKRDENSVEWNKIVPFTSYEILGYRVTPLKADHAKGLNPVIYIIEKDNKALLYAHDTGYFLDETWEYIEKSDIKFNFVSLDCTSILNESAYSNHMGIKACTDVKDRLLKTNADENTVFCLHHFSHNGKLIYDDLVPVAKEEGFEVSYDSAEFEF
ncbi:MAG: hypothetical protein IKC01_09140 [Clostridia bacterium]|nr:hypothetical protein [Clostridia bacterium]